MVLRAFSYCRLALCNVECVPVCPLHRSTPPDSDLTSPDRRWCATSVDSLGTVQEWEYCHPMCKSGDCAFLLPHEYGSDVLLCQDGTRCLTNITGTNGWSCCNSHGGRVSCSCSSHTVVVHSCTRVLTHSCSHSPSLMQRQCPQNLPVMCTTPYTCAKGMDYCCEQTPEACDKLQGPRQCFGTPGGVLPASWKSDGDLVVVWDQAQSLWYNTTWPLSIAPTNNWYDDLLARSNRTISDCSECVECMDFLIAGDCDFSQITVEEAAECLSCVESW
jgi:hypothetical protein